MCHEITRDGLPERGIQLDKSLQDSDPDISITGKPAQWRTGVKCGKKLVVRLSQRASGRGEIGVGGGGRPAGKLPTTCYSYSWGQAQILWAEAVAGGEGGTWGNDLYSPNPGVWLLARSNTVARQGLYRGKFRVLRVTAKGHASHEIDTFADVPLGAVVTRVILVQGFVCWSNPGALSARVMDGQCGGGGGHIITFDDVESAKRAKEALYGADIYSGCCTLKIDFAKFASATARFVPTRPALGCLPVLELVSIPSFLPRNELEHRGVFRATQPPLLPCRGDRCRLYGRPPTNGAIKVVDEPGTFGPRTHSSLNTGGEYNSNHRVSQQWRQARCMYSFLPPLSPWQRRVSCLPHPSAPCTHIHLTLMVTVKWARRRC
uniref:RRM domain-containing protein n=1 Tax=Timema cristinae TaxID=61476 RepID=A0A7R9GPF4_TIMCR|nr:unnamed protein product [Timema cristinae]